jgi:hypothetical protein
MDEKATTTNDTPWMKYTTRRRRRSFSSKPEREKKASFDAQENKETGYHAVPLHNKCIRQLISTFESSGFEN